MNILKNGMKHNVQTVEVECTGHGNGGKGCGAVLQINRKDIFQTSFTCIGQTYGKVLVVDGRGNFKTFLCPDCGGYTDLPDSFNR